MLLFCELISFFKPGIKGVNNTTKVSFPGSLIMIKRFKVSNLTDISFSPHWSADNLFDKMLVQGNRIADKTFTCYVLTFKKEYQSTSWVKRDTELLCTWRSNWNGYHIPYASNFLLQFMSKKYPFLIIYN